MKGGEGEGVIPPFVGQVYGHGRIYEGGGGGGTGRDGETITKSTHGVYMCKSED